MSLFDYFKTKERRTEYVRQIPTLEQELLDELSENCLEDERTYSEDIVHIRAFEKQLQDVIDGHVRKLYPNGGASREKPPPVDGDCAFYLSPDRLNAYLCLLPPISGGKHATLNQVLEDLHFEGISYGIDHDALKAAVESDFCLHIIPIARGQQPKDGQDAQVQDFFPRKNVFQMEAAEGAHINFNEDNLIQAVHKGEVLSRITPEIPSVDGMDVTGRVLHGKNGRRINLVKGDNTVISQDGLFLIAGIDGAVCSNGSSFWVERRKVVFSDVDASIGDLDYPGAVLIKGDVCEGRTVKATGNIIIEGSVKNAYIFSGGSVRIQHGIQGGHTGSVRAANQVQCKTIEETVVVAGGSVFSETVVDSDVTSGGSVYVVDGRGLVVGGQIKARYAVEAKRIGNQASALNILIINYNPEAKQKIQAFKQELKKVQQTLEELRKHILNLRGKSTNISPDQRNLLNQLLEQRTLYESHEADLSAGCRDAQQKLDDVSANWIISEEILPTTVVRLGDKSFTFKTHKKNCRVQMISGVMVCL